MKVRCGPTKHGLAIASAYLLCLGIEIAQILGFGPHWSVVSVANPTFLTPIDFTYTGLLIVFYLFPLFTVLAVLFTDNSNADALFDSDGSVRGAPVWIRVVFAFVLTAIINVVYGQQLFTLAFILQVPVVVAFISVAFDISPLSTSTVREWLVYGAGFSVCASVSLIAAGNIAFNSLATFAWVDQNLVAGGPYLAAIVMLATVWVTPLFWAYGSFNPAWPAVSAWYVWGIYQQQHVFPNQVPQSTFPLSSKQDGLAAFAFFAMWWNLTLTIISSQLLITNSPLLVKRRAARSGHTMLPHSD